MKFSSFLETTLLAGVIFCVPLASASGMSGAGSCGDTESSGYRIDGSGNTNRPVSLTMTPLDAGSLKGLAINDNTGILCDQESVRLAATATWDNGTTSEVPATWSLSPTSFASIDSSTGVLTTYREGADQGVTVHASYTQGGVTMTATKPIYITNCHVDGPPYYVPFLDGGSGCAVTGNIGGTNPMDLAGAYAVLFLILGWAKARGSRRKR